ncbi:MAG: DUF2079 domain-containing protein [Candidatus Wallbacteria bacterium]|nr:DUF2079 domain-containing protein [Candidatus Wallbacteria bacterium]
MNAGPARKPTRPPGALLATLALAAAFAILAAGFSFARFDTFKSHLHDTGLIAQSFWSTTQGRLFVNSVNPEIGRSPYYFGNHFTPIYFLLAPFYWLVPSPKTLLALQALLVALGAVPVYGLARMRFESPRAALVFASLYLLHPAIWFACLYDFHSEAFSGTFLLYAILYLELGAWPQFWTACALAMACKEHVSLVVAALGLLLVSDPQTRKRGVIITATGAATFLIVNFWIIPAFSGTSGHPYLAERYAHLGTGPAAIAWNALTHPLTTLGHLATGRHLYYAICLLGPVLFLPLYRPASLLIGLPIFLANGLSSLLYTYDIGFYHAASILPAVFWATLRSAAALHCKVVPRLGARGCAVLLLANALFWHCQTQSAFLPGLFAPLSPNAHRSDFAVGDHERLIEDVRRQLPTGASLSVQFNLASHFTDREKLYQFPNRVGEVDWVLLDLTEPYRFRPDFRRFWLEFSLQVKVPRFVEAARGLLADRRYGLVYARDGFLLFRRGAGDTADRGGARHLLEERATLWLSYAGRGYGRDRHVWDKDPKSPPATPRPGSVTP